MSNSCTTSSPSSHHQPHIHTYHRLPSAVSPRRLEVASNPGWSSYTRGCAMVKTRPADLICNSTRQSPQHNTIRNDQSAPRAHQPRRGRLAVPHPPLRRIFAFSPLNLLRVILRRPAPGSKPGRDGELFPCLLARICVLACSLGVPREGSSNVGSRMGRVRRTGRARRGTRAAQVKITRWKILKCSCLSLSAIFALWLQNSSEDLPSGHGGWWWCCCSSPAEYRRCPGRHIGTDRCGTHRAANSTQLNPTRLAWLCWGPGGIGQGKQPEKKNKFGPKTRDVCAPRVFWLSQSYRG